MSLEQMSAPVKSVPSDGAVYFYASMWTSSYCKSKWKKMSSSSHTMLHTNVKDLNALHNLMNSSSLTPAVAT